MVFTKIKALIPNSVKRRVRINCENIIHSIRYYIFDGNLIKPKKINAKKIVFVCKGNVCRSAFAGERLKAVDNLSGFIVDSCGIDVDQGQYPPEDSVTVAAEFDVVLVNRRAKGVQECAIEDADLVFPMEYRQYKTLRQLYPARGKNIKLMRSFAPFPYCLFCDIPDPYGWGEDEFRKCFHLLDKILLRIAEKY